MKDRHQQTLDAAPRGFRGFQILEQGLRARAQQTKDVAVCQRLPERKESVIDPHRVPVTAEDDRRPKYPLVLGAVDRLLMRKVNLQWKRRALKIGIGPEHRPRISDEPRKLGFRHERVANRAVASELHP